jgi:ubiquinone/menaquinone biosynthesis C-methylase UbiE
MSSDSIIESVSVVASPWRQSAYYDNAEKQIELFWGEKTIFRKLFSRLELDTVIELACGHGRHSELIAASCSKLILMDVIKENVEFCRGRLGRFENVDYYLNNGYDFSPVQDASVSAIFCYDAMVHFSQDIVESYIADAARVLQSGGMALFHHSNYAGPAKKHYGLHPHARNCMTMAHFAEHSKAVGLEVVESTVIPWGGVADLDGITLLRK